MRNGKSTLFLAATIVTVLNFSSCSKYEEGPMFSLRTKKARITGEWEIVRIGTEVYPQNGYSLEMEFEKDGDLKYTYSYGTYSYTYLGEWEFSSDKEELDIIFENQVQSFEIIKLKNDEVWLEDPQNLEWRLEAK